MVSLVARHDEVVSGSHAAARSGLTGCAVRCRGPVGHDHTLEAPFVPCKLRAGVIIVRGVDAVHLVVAGHDGHRLRLLHGNLKALHVNLADRALGDDAVNSHTVVLTVIAKIMLDRGAAARNALNALGHGSRHEAGNQRIFAEVLEVPAA